MNKYITAVGTNRESFGSEGQIPGSWVQAFGFYSTEAQDFV